MEHRSPSRLARDEYALEATTGTEEHMDPAARRLAAGLHTEHFRLLVESIRDYAIALLDTEGYVRSWGAGAEALTGYRADEIIGTHISKFYPEEMVQGGLVTREL